LHTKIKDRLKLKNNSFAFMSQILSEIRLKRLNENFTNVSEKSIDDFHQRMISKHKSIL